MKADPGMQAFQSLFNQSYDAGYDRIYSPLVTNWYMIFQRLNKDHAMEEVVQDLMDGGVDGLTPPSQKTPSQKSVSDSTCSYSDARGRLNLDWIEDFVPSWGNQIAGFSMPFPGPPHKDTGWQKDMEGLSVQLIDGTTFNMPSMGDIPEEFPPRHNQYGTSYWCQMRAVAGFDLKSGAVLSACQAPMAISEQEMCDTLFGQPQAPTLFIGDANFGIFRVLERARYYSHDSLMALTQKRALSLLNGQPLKSGEEREILWSPSSQDQLAPSASREPIRIRLIYKRIHREGEGPIDLYLATTLLDSNKYTVKKLIQWYGYRWIAEVDFRYLKTQMDMETFDVKSADMAKKEFFMGLIAYNLVRIAMWSSAEREKVNPLSWSFSRCARTLLRWTRKLWLSANCFESLSWKTFWDSLLKKCSRLRLPRRKKERPKEPRKVRMKRRKFSTLKGDRQKERDKMRDGPPLGTPAPNV
jgi:hypothetical protein